MDETNAHKSLYITYDKDLTPVEASEAALKLQNISFDEFRYAGKKENLFCENLNQSLADFIQDNEKALRGQSLLNLDGHFYADGFRALLSRRYPLFSTRNSQLIIGVQSVATPIENIFYPEINAMINSGSIIVHENVKKNFAHFFREKRDHLLRNRWHLSKRELNCVYYVLNGMTNVEIAKELAISVRTVESHIDNIKNKMEIKNKRGIFEKMSEIVLTNF